MIPDLLLFPHCDLHVALDRPRPRVGVYVRRMGEIFNLPYVLTDAYAPPEPGEDPTPPPVFDFYSPYAPVGQRFANLPSVRPDGQIVATTPGIYLFQCSYDGRSIVGRMQVHQAVTDWWFGNESITTAVDGIAHALPTIYAQFSDDNVPNFVGTDLVGDITGHGYVALSSSDPARMEADPRGRLRGIAETGAQPVHLIGTLLNVQRQLPVRVVDYGRLREILEPVVGHSPTKDPAITPNLLFLGEGFTGSTADQVSFDRIVEDIYMGMFIKPRHEPFPMLLPSLNVYKAPAASTQDLLTCGFRVVDQPPLAGVPIPWEGVIRAAAANSYPVRQLVHRVGLPRRGEARPAADLIAEWNTQFLHDFNPANVDPMAVEAWRHQQSVGMLQARDTFFGLHLGQRLADRVSDNHPVPNPGATGTPAQLQAFVRKLYEFYDIRTSQHMQLDPRRHPPELYSEAMDNPQTSLMRYVRGLTERLEPNRHVGFEWAPDLARLKRSRGLVILIAKDAAHGGQNIENGLACLTLASEHKLGFSYGTPSARTMRRAPTGTIVYDENYVTDLAVHELGHSFNLGDEYEEVAGDPTGTGDFPFDNLTTLAAIRSGNGRRFRPDRVKWLHLMRIRLASRVRSEVEPVPGGIRVVVPPDELPLWVAIHAENLEVFLRRAISFTGQQLPLSEANGDLLGNLRIRAIDQALTTIDLTGPQPDPDLPFREGSILFVPLRDRTGAILHVTQRRVLEHFQDPLGGLPLNFGNAPGPDNRPDLPGPIARFTPTNPASYTIGVYEGGGKHATGVYRPAGACKMRNEYQAGDEGALCYVCQWLIVNRINPAMHRRLDLTYSLGTTHV